MKKNFKKNLKNANVFIEDKEGKYFKIFDLQNELGLGKHSFLLDISKNVFVDNSEIEVEILDADGKVIYSEYPDIASEGNSRRISLFIYPENINGLAEITILGYLREAPDEFANKYNVKITRNFTVNKSAENSSALRFYEEPTVIINEERKNLVEKRYDEKFSEIGGVGKVITFVGSKTKVYSDSPIFNKNFLYQKIKFDNFESKISNIHRWKSALCGSRDYFSIFTGQEEEEKSREEPKCLSR